MSVSHDFPDLYCDEAADDVVSSDANTTEHGWFRGSFDSLSADDDQESSIVVAFDSEIDQILDFSDLKRRFCDTAFGAVTTARLEVVNWMLKVHSYFQFRPETAYLSVNYLDRFLLSHTLPQGKGWPMQLLSVACLALAAKMEEISVPFLLDLQIMEPRFLFKPKTVQRMELMVLAILKWRLRPITPFDFLHYFVAKLSCFGLQYEHNNDHVSSQASDVILSTCRVLDFLDFPPSTIAAASVLCVITDQYVDDQLIGCFHQRVSRERLRKCYDLMKQKMCQFPHTRSRKQLLQAVPSPVGIPNGDAIAGSCNAPKVWCEKDWKSRQGSLLNSQAHWQLLAFEVRSLSVNVEHEGPLYISLGPTKMAVQIQKHGTRALASPKI
ncbi:hypothetical protein FNV43_RR17348 [Rhamnella rubrinervis]|uniref:B-like cyclin n=1 Tax=Rhamnella rubrinervis TaxID=2594499 RepID=A0A8K0E1I3_9ROSA|nr:hypothetical protein FNV43_RR17348 [Rhamnella rubrinervis]